ncbi:L-fuco-beta-pyranose dehydrogenase [hydrothermal vent metagenome]|uniref:L-fuco-beta-pyranose dehydrogenase n=1 Tax=hydrothermal vent metagenome TaxID=652676 RepID=A0A3B0YA50_9ZZZZ
MSLSKDEIQKCLEILAKASELEPNSADYLELEQAAAYLRKTAKKKRRLQRKKLTAAKDRNLLLHTTLSDIRLSPDISQASNPDNLSTTTPASDDTSLLIRQRHCYACKEPYRKVHHYFHQLCPSCGDFTLSHRADSLDLRGRRALVTGGRIKIGYAVALRLLRSGAEVHLTTRFPYDAAERFSNESDWDSWQLRLHIYGSDFRLLGEFLQLIAQWQTGPAFDIIINNAAQTVWRPPAYYSRLWEREALLKRQQLTYTNKINFLSSNIQSHTDLNDISLFPVGIKDLHGNPVDLRRENSWVQTLEDVQPIEMIESQVVNNIAPFLLCSQLKENMIQSHFDQRFIINVSAVEGQFNRNNKPARHPHTNMAKAALNMLTRTSADDYAKDNIYMVSVDPGWVSNEGPANQVEKAMIDGIHPPLEMVDAAVRILDPITQALAGQPVYGVLLKNFCEVDW